MLNDLKIHLNADVELSAIASDDERYTVVYIRLEPRRRGDALTWRLRDQIIDITVHEHVEHVMASRVQTVAGGINYEFHLEPRITDQFDVNSAISDGTENIDVPRINFVHRTVWTIAAACT